VGRPGGVKVTSNEPGLKADSSAGMSVRRHSPVDHITTGHWQLPRSFDQNLVPGGHRSTPAAAIAAILSCAKMAPQHTRGLHGQQLPRRAGWLTENKGVWPCAADPRLVTSTGEESYTRLQKCIAMLDGCAPAAAAHTEECRGRPPMQALRLAKLGRLAFRPPQLQSQMLPRLLLGHLHECLLPCMFPHPSASTPQKTGDRPKTGSRQTAWMRWSLCGQP
jgi:hypothetical protein